MARIPEAVAVVEDVAFWQLMFGMCSSAGQDEYNMFESPAFCQAWSGTVSSGLIPGRAEFGQFTGHREDVDAGDGRSDYSTLWDVFPARDWYSVDVELHLRQLNANVHWSCTLDSSVKTRYHGTNFSALIMIARTGGFVPGLNGHGFRGKYSKDVSRQTAWDRRSTAAMRCEFVMMMGAFERALCQSSSK